MDKWLAEIPELGLLADIESQYIAGESSGFTLDSIEAIVRMIAATKDTYDGYVVLIRAENVIRAGIAIEFMLQGFGKPIILTGSRFSPESIAQQDLNKIIKMGGLGLRSNVINSVQIAASTDFAATALMYGNKLIKPTKAMKNSFYSMNLFKSVDEEYLGTIDFGITLQRQKKVSAPAKEQYSLARNVVVVDTNGLELFMKNIPTVKDAKKKVLLVHVNENERLPFEVVQSLKEAFQTVIFFNEHFVLEERRVVVVEKMTWDTAVVKTLWAAAATTTPADLINVLGREAIGEGIQP